MEAGSIFTLGGGDSHSGPHACMTSPFITKPLSATHLLFKNKYCQNSHCMLVINCLYISCPFLVGVSRDTPYVMISWIFSFSFNLSLQVFIITTFYSYFALPTHLVYIFPTSVQVASMQEHLNFHLTLQSESSCKHLTVSIMMCTEICDNVNYL